MSIFAFAAKTTTATSTSSVASEKLKDHFVTLFGLEPRQVVPDPLK